ncbi:MAG: hypothetical protein P8L31_07430 [Pseudomonadales bacterium]|nr:hypothetical protein [Pseudomonadales bacterium]
MKVSPWLDFGWQRDRPDSEVIGVRTDRASLGERGEVAPHLQKKTRALAHWLYAVFIVPFKHYFGAFELEHRYLLKLV